MAIKGNSNKVYKTMRGKVVDMDLLQQRNELTPAVGNARVNARGDELGPGGRIIRKKEQMLKDYYKASTPQQQAVASEPEEAVRAPKAGVKSNSKTRAEQKVEEPAVEKDLTDDWFEDDEGNFVKKDD
jgi:hypothetical protein